MKQEDDDQEFNIIIVHKNEKFREKRSDLEELLFEALPMKRARI